MYKMNGFQYRIKGLLLGFSFGIIFSTIFGWLMIIISPHGLAGVAFYLMMIPVHIAVFIGAMLGCITTGARKDSEIKQGRAKEEGLLWNIASVITLTTIAIMVIIFLLNNCFLHTPACEFYMIIL